MMARLSASFPCQASCWLIAAVTGAKTAWLIRRASVGVLCRNRVVIRTQSLLSRASNEGRRRDALSAMKALPQPSRPSLASPKEWMIGKAPSRRAARCPECRQPSDSEKRIEGGGRGLLFSGIAHGLAKRCCPGAAPQFVAGTRLKANVLKRLAPRAGLEPATIRLTVECSTN